MFQQDKSPTSYNFIRGLAESNIIRKWMAGADLTLGCSVPWPNTTLFLPLGAQRASDFTSTTSHRIAGIFWEIRSRCDYGCICSSYTRVDWPECKYGRRVTRSALIDYQITINFTSKIFITWPTTRHIVFSLAPLTSGEILY